MIWINLIRGKYLKIQLTIIRCNRHIKSWKNRKNSERTMKIKSIKNKYNWEGINFHEKKMTGKKLLTIALNVFYAEKQKIYPSYVFKT